ncbi:hypothetical protein [Streptomyces sp. NPDC006739]|uniref:hypothetical protein n=1 Tax=Streptomyces sp. NPDC006739 TaxID=3364763 RepID=UPI0036C91B93
MPTLTPPPAVRTRFGVTALAVLGAAGASWLAAPIAAAVPGDAGDIRIHRVGVPFGVSKDDPEVCKFYLDAVNFDSLGSIAYTIEAQPPLPTSATVTGTIALGPGSGAGHTDPMSLADGQYRITWVIGTTPKEKIFHVDCHGRHDPQRQDAGDPGRIEDHQGGAPGPGGGEGHQGGGDGPQGGGGDGPREGGDGPRGGVHAGGGGIETVKAYTPVTAAAAVGLVVVSATVYLRLVRRRPHGAA